MSRLTFPGHPSAKAFTAATVVIILLFAFARQIDRIHNPAMSVPTAARVDAKPALLPRIATDYGKLPISFEANQGQTDNSVQFLARGAGYSLFLTRGETVLSLHAPRRATETAANPIVQPSGNFQSYSGPTRSAPSTVRLQLLGSNVNATAAGVDPLPGKSNYFVGSDPAKWHTDVPTYAKVRYSNIYPGIDLLYYGNQEGQLEHDFVLAPGADPNAIAIGLSDSYGFAPDQKGGLNLRTKMGALTLGMPAAYQTIDGERRTIPVSYLLANNQIRFQLGSYDKNKSLVIDPVLAYSAVFGGSGNEYLSAMTIDRKGNVYVTGSTSSADFPLVDSYQSTPERIFVSKLNPTGTALLYSTYFGGTGLNLSSAIAVDGIGRIYLSGSTSGSIPIVNADQPTYGGGASDAFITVLAPGGNAIEWSTFLGGVTQDDPSAMAIDSSGSVYVTGHTFGGFPAFHSIQPEGTPGVWVAKFNKAGVLQYSSLYGNVSGGIAAISADSDESAYITGAAIRSDVPTTPGAFQRTCPGNSCAFAAKLSPAGDSLIYSTTLGAYFAAGTGIAVDSDKNAYVGGSIKGPGLPGSRGFQGTYSGGTIDGFVVKLNPTGSDLVSSTYLGGTGVNSYDRITALALDRYRQVYVTGFSCSHNFPLKASIQTKTATGCQVFVTTLSSSLSSIQYYSTFLGVSSVKGNFGALLAVDPVLNVYVAGVDSDNVYPSRGAYSVGSSLMTSSRKVFVSKLTIMDDLALGISASPSLSVKHGSNLTYMLAVTSKGPDFGYNVRLDDPLPVGTTLVSFAANRGKCTAPIPGATGTLHCTLSQLNKGDTFVVALTVKVNAAAGSTLVNTATAVSNMQDVVLANNKATYTSKVD